MCALCGGGRWFEPYDSEWAFLALRASRLAETEGVNVLIKKKA